MKALLVGLEDVGVVDSTPSLRAMQAFVGGYIEPIYGPDWWAVVDEDGLMKRREPNELATALAIACGWPGTTILVGPVAFMSGDADHPGDVPERVLSRCRLLLPVFGFVKNEEG